MRGRVAIFLVVNFMLVLLPTNVSGLEDEPSWRSNGLDPALWTDGPVEEASPMNQSYQGNAVFVIDVSYHTGLTSSETTGSITIELFEQWAPITTSNIIDHIESGLYDDVFFHRVVDDFVIQSGDPECKVIGTYPVTSPQCSSGGTGETIPLEHNENLSHVDGAMGMARGAEEDSADSQWYITDTDQHGLDPENRDDGGYAVFGIVRDGMTYVREIASTPTVTNPAPDNFANPGPDLLGRPIREVHIDSMRMLGVADPDGTIRFGVMSEASEPLITGKVLGIGALITIGIIMMFIARIDPPISLNEDTIVTYDAVLINDQADSN
ncbi:MAG: peptidylprolyl isomerase [Candidatus Poseidoniaceae archaeon]